MTDDSSMNLVDQSHAQAGRGGNIVGRDQNKKTSFGGLVAVIAVIIVAIVAIVIGRAVYKAVNSVGALSADSTCSQFLQAPQDEELTAIRKVGIDEGVAGVGSPLALPAISYACSGQPNARLGDVIVKFKGQF